MHMHISFYFVWLKFCGFELIGSQSLNNFSLFFRWEAGPKHIDGVWAPWWYEGVHKSTGFKTENKYPKVLFTPCSLLLKIINLVLLVLIVNFLRLMNYQSSERAL